MASKAYEGNYKAWFLTAFAGDLDVDNPPITQAELEAGTRLLRLVSDGGVTVTEAANNASQALLDTGKVSQNVGTREITALTLQFEADFPLRTDAMWGLFDYGDAGYIAVSPDGDVADLAQDDIVHVFQVESHEPQLQSPARDAKQNFTVAVAVQNWNKNAEFQPTA